MNPDNPNLRTAEMWAEHYDRLRKAYEKLLGQNKIMREALEFYGYLDNYFTTRGQQYDSNVEIDSGEKARAVLAEVDKIEVINNRKCKCGNTLFVKKQGIFVCGECRAEVNKESKSE